MDELCGASYNLNNMKIEEMAGLSFVCTCGKKHSVVIEKLVVGSGIMDDILNALDRFRDGKLFVLADNNTFDVLGRAIIERLDREGFRFKSFVFQTGNRALIPNESAIGRLLMEIEKDTSLVLAVGSGVLNDLARIVSYKMGKSFAIAATAPSMDGYASVVSPLLIGGKKITYPGQYPYAIFADTFIMRNAPIVMIRAGYGDVLGKLTALADWRLSNMMCGEYYCETTAGLVRRGIGRCIDSTEGLAERQDTAIRCLVEALILTGISMGFVGVSRPASGTEHQLAHYWELKAIESGREHALHGNAVGVATVVTAMLYELASDMLPEGIDYPSAGQIAGLLRKTGASVKPGDIGVNRELFVDSMMNAMYLRDKYTLLRFCHERGKLEEFAGILAGRLYD